MERDGVSGTDKSSRGERKSNRHAHANFMGHQLRRIFYDTLLRKQNSGTVPSWLGAPGGVSPCTGAAALPSPGPSLSGMEPRP